ncbi:saccharopine dehydrogenase family protein [Nocardia sp. GCM10030253]|uniref:saccharopine dehydrogenase family protein n=1 Tax=Nocardia sp. GCM10030253 TaxID=3273404 RepID=UPI0036426300
MKVLALGGCGAMGAMAVRTAATLRGVHEIVVADRDLAAAQALAHELADSGADAHACRVDVTDRAALHRVFAEADVVLNTVGPYYRFGLSVLRAAIDTGTHYLDICDDWEPTVQMLDFDDDARAAGVCAIIGMGASPGVSNLLAARAARELDSLADIYTAWPVDVPTMTGADTQLTGPDGTPTAAAVHWMQQISGTVAVVRAGDIVREPPLRPVTLAVPGGRAGTAYTVGHPEPVTLRRTLAPSGTAANLMVITPGTAAYLDGLRTDLDRGTLTNESAAVALAEPTMRRGLRSMVRSVGFKSPGTLPPFFAVAYGSKNGDPHAVLAHLDGGASLSEGAALTDDMARATGIPLALSLAQLVDGVAIRPGVHPPEGIIDIDRFFDDLAAHLDPERQRGRVVVEQCPIGTLPPVGRRDHGLSWCRVRE